MPRIKKYLNPTVLVLAVFVAWFLSYTIPLFAACFYAVPAYDDFGHGTGWITTNQNHLVYIIHKMANSYTSWGGNYFHNAMVIIPLYYIFGLKAMRIFLAINFLFFLVGAICLAKESTHWLGVDKEKKVVIGMALLTMLLFFPFTHNQLDEVFCWCTCAWNYSMPISFAMLSTSCYMIYNRKKSKLALVAGCIMAFFVAGAATNVAVLACTLLFLEIAYDFLITRSIKANVWIGAVAVLGTLVNVCAPGNFVRHEVLDSTGLHPIWLSLMLLVNIGGRFAEYFQEGYLLAALVVIFVLTNIFCRNSDRKFDKPLLVTIYCFLAIFAVDFPAALGYSAVGFSGRVGFVEVFTIALFSGLCAAYWGGIAVKAGAFRFRMSRFSWQR